MLFLFLALLSCLVAPPLYWFGARNPIGLKILHVFVGMSVLYLTLFHILPSSFYRINYHAILVGLAGFFILTIVEMRWNQYRNRIGRTSLMLALLGLTFHTLIDGAALAQPNFAVAQSDLAMAIVLHRLPVCIMFWGLLFPRVGLGKTLAVYGLISVSTVIGFGLSDLVFQSVGNEANLFAVFEAFVAGTLLHVAAEPFLHKIKKTEPNPSPTV